MSYIRTPPIPVVQTSAWWCWAAYMEMINRAHPAKFTAPVRNQAHWVADMQASPAANTALNQHGGLNTHFFGQFTQALRMQFRVWTGPPANAPDLAFAEVKLHKSLLLAAYQVPGGSHFVVIHGFDGTHVRYTNPQPQGGRSASYVRTNSIRCSANCMEGVTLEGVTLGSVTLGTPPAPCAKSALRRL